MVGTGLSLQHPLAILVGSGLAAVVPSVMDSLHNGGAHGFSEMLYAYSSCGGITALPLPVSMGIPYF